VVQREFFEQETHSNETAAEDEEADIFRVENDTLECSLES
jgi:hypothetical protein